MTFLWMSDHVSVNGVDGVSQMMFWLTIQFFRGNVNMNEWDLLQNLRKSNTLQCPENSTLLKRQVIVALLTFRLTEQGTFSSAHEKKQGFLASSYSCTCHIFATL